MPVRRLQKSLLHRLVQKAFCGQNQKFLILTDTILLIIKAKEKIIIGTAIEFFQLDQDARPDIQLPRLIFGVGRSADIT